MICVCPCVGSLCKTSIGDSIKHSCVSNAAYRASYLCTGTVRFQGKSSAQESIGEKDVNVMGYMRTTTIIQDLGGKCKVSMHLKAIRPNKAREANNWSFHISNQHLEPRFTGSVERDVNALVRRCRLDGSVKVCACVVILALWTTTLPTNVFLYRRQDRAAPRRSRRLNPDRWNVNITAYTNQHKLVLVAVTFHGGRGGSAGVGCRANYASKFTVPT